MSFGIGKKYCRIKCICLFFLFIIWLPVFSVNQENTLTEKKIQPYMVFTINSVEHSLFGTIVKYNVSYSENFPFGSSFVECYRDSKGYSVVNKVNLSFNMEFYFGYLIIPNDRMMLALQFGQRWDNAHVIEDIGLLGVGAFKGIVDLTKCKCE